MEELWPPPRPAAAEMIRALCERLLADVDAMAEAIAEASVAPFSDPGMLADGSLQKETREHNRSDLVQWLTSNIQRPGARVEPYVGRRIAAYIEDLSRRGLAPDPTAGWRAALGVGWKRWVEACIEYSAEPEVLIEVLDRSAHSLVQYALDHVAMLREASLDAAIDHASAQAVAMIQLIASGAPINQYLAEERLGYRMAREHCALLLWTDGPEQAEELERALTALRAATRGQPQLVARASTASRWLWFSGPTRPDRSLLEQTLKEFPRVSAAIGRTSNGLEGFRSSHQEALAAQSMLVRLGASRRFTEYAEVELVDGLTKDRQSAQRFVLSTLGELAAADASLRQALLTYIQCGFTATRVASKLFLHRNTVERRVARANELSATKVEDNPVHLAAALLVLDLVPEFATSSD